MYIYIYIYKRRRWCCAIRTKALSGVVFTVVLQLLPFTGKVDLFTLIEFTPATQLSPIDCIHRKGCVVLLWCCLCRVACCVVPVVCLCV